VLLVGWSPVAIAVCVLSYLIRMFGITAFYHRCFSHRAFRVTRPMQLMGACLGASAAQRGPLWWVAHHRRHHQRTDRIGDPHSPVIDGLPRSHVLWMFAPANRGTDSQVVPDLAAYRELRLLDRYHHVMPGLYAAGMFGLGVALHAVWSGSHTSGLQMLVFGFSISTVLLYHATFAVNSLGHTIGSRKFDTNDESHNNWWLAILTLGEGWHNNHHRFPYAARAGLAVWEADMTWMALRLMASLRLVRDLRPVPVFVNAGSGRPNR
jgi:stearoyl-CoA desaturase (delta-9 desaturase)